MYAWLLCVAESRVCQNQFRQSTSREEGLTLREGALQSSHPCREHQSTWTSSTYSEAQNCNVNLSFVDLQSKDSELAWYVYNPPHGLGPLNRFEIPIRDDSTLSLDAVWLCLRMMLALVNGACSAMSAGCISVRWLTWIRRCLISTLNQSWPGYWIAIWNFSCTGCATGC